MSIDNRTHIIHDRERNRTVGYRIDRAENGIVEVEVARAICSKRDNFNKKVARSIVNTRLDSVERGTTAPNLGRVHFAAEVPTNSRDWRTFEQTLMSLADAEIPQGR